MVVLPYEVEAVQLMSADCCCHVSSPNTGRELNGGEIMSHLKDVFCSYGDHAV